MKKLTKMLALLFCLILVVETSRAQNWVQIIPTSGNAPAPRSNAAAIYDSLNHRLVIFSGKSAAGSLNDVWALDLKSNSWSDLTPSSGAAPAPRFTANGVYNLAQQQMIIWSGQGASFFNDVWAFDLNAKAWTPFNPPDPKPSIRYGTAAIFDPRTKEVVTFAGFNQGRFDDTWRFNVNSGTWKDVSPAIHPEKRCLHSASYDALKHRMIIYGGQTSGARGDIWTFDLAKNMWTDLTPQSSPAGRWFSTNIFDTANNRVIIFGGNLGSSKSNEVWAFDLAKNSWQQISASGTLPAAREGAVAIYIRNEARMVVFGGVGNTYFNDIWSLNKLSPTTGVESNSGNELPKTFRLLGNYPNPFNPETTIAFEMSAANHVSLRVYNLQGQLIRNLFDGKVEAGRHQMIWNGTNDLGAKVVSGIYFYALKAEAISVSRKMALVE